MKHKEFLDAIDITNIKGRRLVMAESEALHEMSGSYHGYGNRQDLEKTLQLKKWRYGGETEFGFTGGLEKLCYEIDDIDEKQTVIIESQHMPTSGQSGNFKIYNMGSYGVERYRNCDGIVITGGVLYEIYKVTKKDHGSASEKEKEKKLAKLFLHCLKKGSPISTLLLKEYELYIDENLDERKKVLELLNKILILTGIKEITRRMYGSKINLPFSIAYLQGT